MKLVDFIFIVMIFVAIILAMVTIILIINAIKKNKNYIICEGTIVDFYENDSSLRVGDDPVKAISPVIYFKVKEKEYKFTGNYCNSTMKVGDKIKILYNKNNPNKATIKQGLFIAPIITGALTTFSIIALIIIKIFK